MNLQWLVGASYTIHCYCKVSCYGCSSYPCAVKKNTWCSQAVKIPCLLHSVQLEAMEERPESRLTPSGLSWWCSWVAAHTLRSQLCGSWAKREVLSTLNTKTPKQYVFTIESNCACQKIFQNHLKINTQESLLPCFCSTCKCICLLWRHLQGNSWLVVASNFSFLPHRSEVHCGDNSHHKQCQTAGGPARPLSMLGSLVVGGDLLKLGPKEEDEKTFQGLLTFSSPYSTKFCKDW